MISYVRGVILHINMIISTTNIDKSIFEEKQQFIQFTIAMFGNYYYILKFMLQINALIETFTILGNLHKCL